MGEIAMAPLTASIDKAVLLQFSNQFPNLSRHSFQLFALYRPGNLQLSRLSRRRTLL